MDARSSMREAGGASDHQKGSSDGMRTVLIIFVSLIIDLLGFTMILPLLPSLLEYYGRDRQDSLYNLLQSSVDGFRQLVGAPDTPRWNAVLFGGLIGSLFSFLQFLSSPLIGAASDTYGRKRTLLFSMLGLALSYSIWAVSANFTLFVVARVIGGISKGNVSISVAVVTDVTTREKRGRGMAMIGIAFSIAFIIGPILGAGFAKLVRSQQEMFFQAPAFVALTLVLFDVFFLAACFRESLPVDKRAPSIFTGINDALKYINPVSLFKFSAVDKLSMSSMYHLTSYGLVYFLYLFIYAGLEFTLTFLVHNRFQYDSMQQGKMFFLIGIVMVFVQGGYVRRLKPGSERGTIVKGIMTLISSFLIVGLSTSTALFYFGLMLFAYASSTVVPCMTTIVSSFGDENQKGKILGILRSLGALARALGPVFASVLFWCFGAEVCYVIGSILLVLPLVLLKKIKTSDQSQHEE